MGFQTNNPIRANDGIMNYTRRQVEAVPRLQRHLFSQAWQPKGDRSINDVDDLMEGVGVGAVGITWGIRPAVKRQSF